MMTKTAILMRQTMRAKSTATERKARIFIIQSQRALLKAFVCLHCDLGEEV